MIRAYSSFDEAYKDLARGLLQHGESSTTRRNKTIHELFDVSFQFEPALDCLAYSRNFSREYLYKELKFYASGSNLLKDAAECSSFWNNCSDNGKTINSNYGRLLFHETYSDTVLTQFEYALSCLESNPQSKKAVMSIYSPTNAYISKDNPCTMFLRLRIDSKEKLHLSTYMRSSDIYFGLPYDVPFFVFVQWCACNRLLETYPDITMGSYTHHAATLHYYQEKHIELQQVAAKKRAPSTPRVGTDKELMIEFNRTYHSLFGEIAPLSKEPNDNTFMKAAWKAAEKSTCLKKSVGAVAVFRNKIVTRACGGNQNWPCETCAREDIEDTYYGDECPSVHAEMNCIVRLLRMTEIPMEEVTIYVTHGPCDACLKLCDLVGVPRVVFDKPYKTNYDHWPNVVVDKIDFLNLYKSL